MPPYHLAGGDLSRGIAVLADWQFDVLGRYHPILTLLAVGALFGLPLYLLGFVRSRQARRRAALPRQAARRAMRFARVLLATAVALMITAVVTLALIWLLPSTNGTPAVVVAATTATPPSGPVTLTGDVVYDRITALDEKLWFLGRSIRFVPVVAPGGGDRGSTLRFFVALLGVDPAAPDPTPRAWTGTLRQGGLPGEIIRLYRYVGYRVEAPYYVLFTQAGMLTWPYRLLALQFAGGAGRAARRAASTGTCPPDAARTRTRIGTRVI